MVNKIEKNISSEKSKSTSKKKDVILPIDLPGEPIQCWIGDAEKITVILRKHRDLIIDINFGGGVTYTVWTEKSEMYDTRNKKLIHPKEKISFKDGEILHMWVGRGFSGKIFIFEGMKKIAEYSISVLDPSIENFDPIFKPAPISIVMKNDFIPTGPKEFNVIQPDGSLSVPANSELQEAEKFMQIVEIKLIGKDIPKNIIDFFAKGGEKEIVSSGGVATRNWVINQVFAACGYLAENKKWISELWDEKLVLRSVDHSSGRKVYVVLTGSSRVRRLITGTTYGVTNAKVLAFSFGAGSAAGLRHSTWSAARGSLRGTNLYVILFTISLDIAEWISDYEKIDSVTGNRKQDVADLFIKIGVDVVKAVVSQVIGNFVMWGALALVSSTPMIVIIIGTMVVSVFVGFAIDYFDKKNKVSEKIALAIKMAPGKLEEKMRNDYDGYVNSLMATLKRKGMIYDIDTYPTR